MSDKPDRLTEVEVHVTYLRKHADKVDDKLDAIHALLTKRSPWAVVAAAVVTFVGAHWKSLAIVLLTLFGAGWAAPILAALTALK
jgi:hypothetical protein